MDNRIVFTKTDKGEDEAHSRSAHLSGDIRRALLMVDGTANYAEISKRAAPSLRAMLDGLLLELMKAGFIEDKARIANIPRMVVPKKIDTPNKLQVPRTAAVDELDFTAAYRAPSAETLAAEAAAQARLKTETEAKAREVVERHAKEEAQLARQNAEREAAKMRAELAQAQAKAENETKLRVAQETKAKQEAQVAKDKAKAEADAAKLHAEQETAKAKSAAEAARLQAEQESAQVRAELAATKAQAQEEAKARVLAEEKFRQEAAAAKLKVVQEAERVRIEVEKMAAQRAEAEQQAKQLAEAARLKAEQEAAQIRAELTAVKAKAEAEARARAEAEKLAQQEAQARALAEEKLRQEAAAAKLKAQQEAEQARIAAEQAAAQAREEAAAAKRQAEAEAKARAEAEKLAQQEAQARALAEEKLRQESNTLPNPLLADNKFQAGSSIEPLATTKSSFEVNKIRTSTEMSARSTSATVLFFDVIGYTKQSVNKQIIVKNQFNQILTDCLNSLGEDERIILDTGDGAAIGFIHHPEDAIVVATQFLDVVLSNQHQDYPDLKVRIGIHLGPINIVKDMNGQSNMLGDGINDAQRVMGFASANQIYISSSYYDFISRLNDEYAAMFEYRGTQKDKHKREHQVYELIDAGATEKKSLSTRAASDTDIIKLDPFILDLPQETHYSTETKRSEKFSSRSNALDAPTPMKVAELPATQSEQNSKIVPPVATATSAPESAAKERQASATENKLLASAQAKEWTAAEQRALETAKINADRAMQQVTQSKAEAQAEGVKAVALKHKRRKPIPWWKVAVASLVLFITSLFVVPMVISMQGYAEKIAKIVTEKTKQPIRIGQVSGRLLPTPRLTLRDVAVGETKQLHLDQAQLEFSLGALFSANKPIHRLNLQGVQINAQALPKIVEWLGQVADNEKYAIAQVELNHGKLELQNLLLSELTGQINFDQVRQFSSAKLMAEGGKYALEIDAQANGKYPVKLAIHNAALPYLPKVSFDEFNAKGLLSAEGVLLSDIDSRILGGIVLGDAQINWHKGWAVQGSLTAKVISMQNLNKLLSGNMDGNGHFQMQAASLSGLADSFYMNGAFLAKQGVINGVDIVETARLRSKENLPGGRTHYEALSGDVSFAQGVYQFKNLKINANLMNATGQINVDKQGLSGRLSAELSMRSGMGAVTLQLGGTPESPELKAVR